MKNYKFRIYPTKKQETQLKETLRVCSVVWNKCLEHEKNLYETEGKYANCFALNTLLVSMKKEIPAVAGIHSQVLQNIAERVDLAYKAFFRRVKAGEKPGFPRFKSSFRYNSFTYPQSGFKLINENRLKLSKIGHVKIVLHRSIEGKIKRVTIKHTASGKWFATFTTDVVSLNALPKTGKTVGIDVGLKTFATMSDGSSIKNPRFFKTEQPALAKVQRQLQKQENGTPARAKRRKRVALVYERISNKRSDFLWKQANQLVRRYDEIFVEDLSIQQMLEQKKFSKSIADVAWGEFSSKLAFKAAEAGKLVKKVNPRNTSKTCCVCQNILETLTLSDRVYACPKCGNKRNRDLNASLNILRLGLQSVAKA